MLAAEQHGLGDFQLEPLRRQAGLRERAPQHGQQIAPLELRRGDIDRERDM
jgi:hypothetical protein